MSQPSEATVAVDAVEDFGGPDPAEQSLHGATTSEASTVEAPVEAAESSDVARRSLTHPLEEDRG